VSIKVVYRDGVFEPLEKVECARPGAIYMAFAEDELRDLIETLGWLKASEKSSSSGTTRPMPSTTNYKRGDIVLVSFPFTDLSSSKRRPALVVSPDEFNGIGQEVVLVAITSQEPDDRAISIDSEHLVTGRCQNHCS
jgi:hypothetical protein